ncbi:MAG: hydantoinase/oxoprolinase family protein [Rhodospirillales bacterium]|nr:hydantoinase/oxoprolinase family protein [Rhodospirillales bacterium]
MSLKIGIDVGGTFTDFIVAWDTKAPGIFKVLSTPHDPSIAVVEGLKEIADAHGLMLEDLAGRIDTIVHGTTVTTNATLTRTGAHMGLITTKGVRDALEMRRGIREEQYNNRYTNVPPLAPRYLRVGVSGRLDRNGRELEPLSLDEVRAAVELFKREKVQALAICFMNAFANPAHEKAAAELVRRELPDAYLTVSTDLLPSIRFYERVSTTALNSYVGPKLTHYLSQLTGRLKGIGFKGLLLIMQSNGGVITPEIAREKASLTLLSGPAGGPGAGLAYAAVHGLDRAITTDMGGTSFEASLAAGGPLMVNDGEIDRLRIALPMLGIHTIGAGGGSIGWLDEGGLLRMGPASAGADPGPACYGKGGQKPCSTDANLVLGYLDPDYFAGGKMKLDIEASRRAIREHVAKPMGLSLEEAAAGMYRVICNNMAQGVREVTIKRGHDPREFPLIAAGGAGPIHSCLICDELEMPFQIVPRTSSILCAFGMLLSDLKHDFVRTFVARLEGLDWGKLKGLIESMVAEGNRLLDAEHIPANRRKATVKFDCRYLKQYHEVSFEVPKAALEKGDTKAVAKAFHAEHNRLYGYSLEELKTPVEIINVRVESTGVVEKPSLRPEPYDGPSSAHAQKGKRSVYVPESKKFETVPVFDGHKMKHGNRVKGPALIEQITTAIFVSAGWDCVVDSVGSFALYRKGREDLVKGFLGRTAPKAPAKPKAKPAAKAKPKAKAKPAARSAAKKAAPAAKRRTSKPTKAVIKASQRRPASQRVVARQPSRRKATPKKSR